MKIKIIATCFICFLFISENIFALDLGELSNKSATNIHGRFEKLVKIDDCLKAHKDIETTNKCISPYLSKAISKNEKSFIQNWFSLPLKLSGYRLCSEGELDSIPTHIMEQKPLTLCADYFLLKNKKTAIFFYDKNLYLMNIRK